MGACFSRLRVRSNRANGSPPTDYLSCSEDHGTFVTGSNQHVSVVGNIPLGHVQGVPSTKSPLPTTNPSRKNGIVSHSLSSDPSLGSLVPPVHLEDVAVTDVDGIPTDGDKKLQISCIPQPQKALGELEEAISGCLSMCSVITEHDIREGNMQMVSCGNFGIVYHISKGGREFALKRMRHDDSICMEQIRKELKTLRTIGQHENILGFEGSVQVEALLRDIFIVTEFCSLGDIETYIDKRKGNFRNTIKDDIVWSAPPDKPAENGGYKDATAMFGLTTVDFIRWAIECATGMDFLARLGHAHGDLAPRNLLLDGNGKLKICDFGLSRRLKHVQGTPYYRLSNDSSAVVPWDHYNVEFFDGGNITTLTDIWAYGVTIWEIFELGKKPFAGEFDDKSTDIYATALRNGLRLSKPKYTTTEIFRIINSCWKPNPNERPTFQDLRSSFQAQLPNQIPDVACEQYTDENAVVYNNKTINAKCTHPELLNVGISITGTSINKLLLCDRVRCAVISIENHLDAPLSGGQTFLCYGESRIPAQALVKARTHEAIAFDKASGTATGVTGIVTYKIAEAFRFAIAFSVPYDYTFWRNWFGLVIINDGCSVDQDLYDKFYGHNAWGQGTGSAQFGKAKHGNILRITNGSIEITATMSDAEQSLVSVVVMKCVKQ